MENTIQARTQASVSRIPPPGNLHHSLHRKEKPCSLLSSWLIIISIAKLERTSGD
jgi:hypothetical protein